jgi:hypothetical protein
VHRDGTVTPRHLEEEALPVPYPRSPSAPTPEHNQPDLGPALRLHILRVLRRLPEVAGARPDLRGNASGAAADAGLRRRILDAMAFVPAFEPARIGIAVTDGVVRLTGAVDHPEARKAVEYGVRSVARVRAVVNRIQIDPGPRSAVTRGGRRLTDEDEG